LHPPSGLASGLHGWEQQGDENPDNRDYDKQLDKRETAIAAILEHGVFSHGMILCLGRQFSGGHNTSRRTDFQA
jgi:hypothetical protein